ncbi:2-dehydro-3-deoxy-D-gluconate 5-dehydrogenase KduD [Thermovorax subterraneus]|nr:2-dehydro-3-deoxy-D-gluconate 5-dehydrogenase KduD [Thermovorax subterraneus]
MADLNFLKEYFSLEGKVAMVTGGNSGIGRAIATALARAGADIFLYVHSERNIEDMKKELERLGRRLKYEVGELEREEDAMSAVEKCVEAYGRIDILVNNAGTIHRAPILEGDNESWKKVINVNLSAVYYLSKVAAKYMVAQGSGKIINVASMLSFQGGIYVPSYAASKHGVAGLTKAFANELASKNVQVNAIAPGYIETANTRQIREDEKRYKEILSRIPAGRWGVPEDVAGAAVFLASKASDYVNGHILCVDGGWMAR